ncbi:MAG: hypothetical protein ACO1NQ_00710 [Flavobacteriales bacterium]
MRTLPIILVMAFSIMTAPLLAAPPETRHHVMWTSAKGKMKCCNKRTDAKAEAFAAKLRAKGKVSNVQVMTGPCSAMR